MQYLFACCVTVFIVVGPALFGVTNGLLCKCTPRPSKTRPGTTECPQGFCNAEDANGRRAACGAVEKNKSVLYGCTYLADGKSNATYCRVVPESGATQCWCLEFDFCNADFEQRLSGVYLRQRPETDEIAPRADADDYRRGAVRPDHRALLDSEFERRLKENFRESDEEETYGDDTGENLPESEADARRVELENAFRQDGRQQLEQLPVVDADTSFAGKGIQNEEQVEARRAHPNDQGHRGSNHLDSREDYGTNTGNERTVIDNEEDARRRGPIATARRIDEDDGQSREDYGSRSEIGANDDDANVRKVVQGARRADDQSKEDYGIPNNVDEPFSIKAAAEDINQAEVVVPIIPVSRITAPPPIQYPTVDYSNDEEPPDYQPHSHESKPADPRKPPYNRVPNFDGSDKSKPAPVTRPPPATSAARPIVEPLSRPPAAWEPPHWAPPAPLSNERLSTPPPTYRTYRPVQIKTVNLARVVPTTSTTTSTSTTTTTSSTTTTPPPTSSTTTTTTTTTTSRKTTISITTITARQSSTKKSTTTVALTNPETTTTVATTKPTEMTTTTVVTSTTVPELRPVTEKSKEDYDGEEEEMSWGLTGNTKRPSGNSPHRSPSSSLFLVAMLTLLLRLFLRGI